MAIEITAIQQAGGTGHQHIWMLWWTNPSTSTSGNSSREELVSWIEDRGGEAYVQDRFGNRVNVGVVDPDHGQKFLRTYADGYWTDNLLALPRV